MPTEPVPWLDDAELDAWVQLIRLAARIVALSDGELRRHHGITGRDYELLHHLSGSVTGYRVSELAERIDDSSSCITHRVNRLCDAGLITKRVENDDQRAKRVRLSARGRRLLESAAPEHVRRVRHWIFDPLESRDVDDLARIARRLNEHLRTIAPL